MKNKMNKGSITIETTITLAISIVVIIVMIASIYAYIILNKSFIFSSKYIIKNNYKVIDNIKLENEIANKHLKINTFFKFKVFNLEEEFYNFSDYSHSSLNTVYITDTGSKYHRKDCPTCAISLKLREYDDVKKKYAPCKVCFP